MAAVTSGTAGGIAPQDAGMDGAVHKKRLTQRYGIASAAHKKLRNDTGPDSVVRKKRLTQNYFALALKAFISGAGARVLGVVLVVVRNGRLGSLTVLCVFKFTDAFTQTTHQLGNFLTAEQ